MASREGVWARVLRWLEGYTFELVHGINETTRQRLTEAIQEFVERPITMGDLKDAIAPIFGVERASTIAVTEVTRAYVAGGNIAADEIRSFGFEVLDTWHTANDDLVCDLCDHEGKVRGDGWTEDPPAHPNCRCSVEHEVA